MRRHPWGRVLLALLLLALPLAGCGKKNPPEVPHGETSTFPRTYPRQ